MCSTSTRSTEVQYYYIISQNYKYFASGRLATATMMKWAPGWHNHNHNHKNMARQKKSKNFRRGVYCSIYTTHINNMGRGSWVLRDVDLKNPVWVKNIAYSILYGD